MKKIYNTKTVIIHHSDTNYSELEKLISDGWEIRVHWTDTQAALFDAREVFILVSPIDKKLHTL